MEGGGVDPTPRSTREGDQNGITAFRRCRLYRNRLSGDSAIPESRATGATTSPITRDGDRPIDEVTGLPTVQSAKRVQRNTVRREEGESNRETPRQRLPVDNVIRRQSEGRGGRGLLHPSRQQRPSEEGRGGLPTMISHGVEISMAGGVGEMVRANISKKTIYVRRTQPASGRIASALCVLCALTVRRTFFLIPCAWCLPTPSSPVPYTQRAWCGRPLSRHPPHPSPLLLLSSDGIRRTHPQFPAPGPPAPYLLPPAT